MNDYSIIENLSEEQIKELYDNIAYSETTLISTCQYILVYCEGTGITKVVKCRSWGFDNYLCSNNAYVRESSSSGAGIDSGCSYDVRSCKRY